MTMVPLLLLLCSSFFFLVAANDDCINAINLSAQNLPLLIEDETTNATVDFPTPTDSFSGTTCGIKPEARGVWYRIDGKGSFIEAKLMDAVGSIGVDFNTALFRGTSCDDMKCMLPSDYQLENQRTEPTSTWYAKEGESYFYHVTGTNQDAVGHYRLSVKELEYAGNFNDMCRNARSGTVGLVIGNSVQSRPHGLSNEDCSLKPSSRGLFYSFDGTGKTMSVTLSILTQDIRLELAIMTMGCDMCVTFSDFLAADDSPHSITFESEPDALYFVAVTGEGFADAGEFKLEVDEQREIDDSGALSGLSATLSERALPILVSASVLFY